MLSRITLTTGAVVVSSSQGYEGVKLKAYVISRESPSIVADGEFPLFSRRFSVG